MIIEAHGQGVSDIHIETYPGKEKLKIRFRRDGVLQPYLELPHTYRNAMIARIKIMCDLDISERRKPQDGKINFAKYSPQHRLELRVATIPTNNGLEDVVMRLLASSKPIPLDRIGLTPANREALEFAVKRPYGMVLCVGPTGSGKTTTLHSALAHINQPERKIWTAEDPVEITQAGLRQVQVNPKIDWTFAKALRAFLRADPDVIMVGEIRDQETAEIAVEASLTGHLVLSTLHTNSAAETITRLVDMGLDPFNFADSLLAVLAQRLVRRACSACQVAEPMTEADVGELLDDYLHVFPEGERPSRLALMADWIKNHGQNGRLMKFHSPGCSSCGNTGYKGRAGLHELLSISKNLRRMIQTGARAEELHHAGLTEGMRSLRQDGIVKVLQGITTLSEVHATSNA
jgi:type II secretory ATPase GspE/PulE/Tfp pilus assembly ATPase PilB-like protein